MVLTTSMHAPTTEFTVDELAQLVGMSPRNIRAHQARKLLPPPARKGRVAFYDDRHVRRLQTIVALQRQGYNLTSIETMLATRGADQSSAAMADTLEQLTAGSPTLRRALSEHGVVTHATDGTVRPARTHALRVALGMRRAGLSGAVGIQLLVRILDELSPVAERLASDLGSQIMALTPEPSDADSQTWEQVDQHTVTLAQGIIELLSAAFRVVVENRSEAVVAEMVHRRFDVDLDMDVDVSAPFDTG